ncbi:MAG: hypothetical protein ABSF47_00160 [Minisyncoccia bacterium]|jgi:hypothetical protein
MGSFKNNRVVLAVFAILMAVGLMAAYIPMLFPPSGSQNLPPDNAPAADNNYSAQLPQNPAPVATTTVTSTLPAKVLPAQAGSLPDSFSGIQDEQKSLDDINNLLK